MREIKFRAWCEFEVGGELHKEMAGPENWFLITQTGRIMSHSPLGGFNPNAGSDYKKIILMQYTGLKDKNGKEIYEGDIVKVREYEDIDMDNKVYQIKYFGDKDYPAFDLEPSLDTDSNGLSHCMGADPCYIEVIGNIWENKELLNGK